ncbi:MULTISPECIES: copper homeostasis protein CutC [unclassified Dyella]|uniref:copper homeostasis protein CutC n=1 Tax=unclassified Dyella TaxID=2634549 RepID=UPI000C81D692|nr:MULTISPECIES: copper homeostasis protein CutC [unclassified Dyella]MDR3445497.1 copper homeostasis protein CutC [Dyella sp.]PMQ05277.1 Copper homeostasis protein CutC [Dyella sp. AD56]
MTKPLLEIAANSLASALAAQAGGADRVELCTGLELGGLTPSAAQIAQVRERLSIPVYVLIRPRAGDFLYNDDELTTMHRDIETCLSLGCDGVVFGVLDADGRVDVPRCKPLLSAAGGMGVTFHRAFDMARSAAQALEDVVALGAERLLTSGGAASAMEGAATIRHLVEQAAGRIAVMPGAGVHASNIADLVHATGATEFHASAKAGLPSGMRWTNQQLPDMAGGEIRTDEHEVRALARALAPLR